MIHVHSRVALIKQLSRLDARVNALGKLAVIEPGDLFANSLRFATLVLIQFDVRKFRQHPRLVVSSLLSCRSCFQLPEHTAIEQPMLQLSAVNRQITDFISVHVFHKWFNVVTCSDNTLCLIGLPTGQTYKGNENYPNT